MYRTIEPASYEFAVNSHDADDLTTATHIGLIAVDSDGNRTTVAVAVPDALVVGKLLIGHHDAVVGREPRNW